jgi:hypothetical protein
MPEEIKQPTLQKPFIGIRAERPPNGSEMSLWDKLLREHRKAGNALDRAGLLLYNIYTTYTFGNSQGIIMPEFDPQIEVQYYDARKAFEASKMAIRGAEDHTYGIRVSNGDIDVMSPEQNQFYGFGGLIIPVIIGLIVLGGAIATAIWQSKIATEVANKYREILFKTDAVFCANPNSKLCSDWTAYKQKHNYQQNITIADSLKKGIKTVAGGLGLGLAAAVGLVVFSKLGSK